MPNSSETIKILSVETLFGLYSISLAVSLLMSKNSKVRIYREFTEEATGKNYFILVMNHFQKKQQGFDLFDFIFKNQNDSIYCASNNTNFEDVKVLVVKLFAFFLHQCRCRYFGTDLVRFHSNNRTQKHHLGRQTLLGQTD